MDKDSLMGDCCLVGAVGWFVAATAPMSGACRVDQVVSECWLRVASKWLQNGEFFGRRRNGSNETNRDHTTTPDETSRSDHDDDHDDDETPKEMERRKCWYQWYVCVWIFEEMRRREEMCVEMWRNVATIYGTNLVWSPSNAVMAFLDQRQHTNKHSNCHSIN